MYKSETYIRVRYADTDQMGIVYHGNYAQYNEVGRVETLRQIGLSYKIIEERGYFLPVLNMNTKFIKPAYYDDYLKIITIIKEIPITRMNFYYEIYNENNILLNISNTEHSFVSKSSLKPCKAPDWVILPLKKFII